MNDAVAAELRAAAARRKASGRELGRRLEIPDMWVSRRMSGTVEISVADLVLLCDAIGVYPLDVMAQALSELESVEPVAVPT